MRNLPDYDERLREEVCRAYSSAALNPTGEHCFPLGREFAESLGYPSDLLAGMPDSAVDAFTGVSNVSMFAEISPGSAILDLGCGAGLDALIAAGRVGSTGKVIGVDFSETMLDRARQASRELGIENVEFHHADAEDLPIDNEAIDVALVNGIFNLNPGRKEVIRELGRVLRPGGTVYAAELVLRESLPDETCSSKSNWFA